MRETRPPAALEVGLPPEGRALSEVRVNFPLVFGLLGWRGCRDSRGDGLRSRAVPGRPGQVGPREGWPRRHWARGSLPSGTLAFRSFRALVAPSSPVAVAGGAVRCGAVRTGPDVRDQSRLKKRVLH